ncbi:M1 family metallopeptidase [Saccharopolyspora shandongensis]|uniref:Aminopeptidase N n=1 Tax=Saccharopolyspora shandongensis TaxID=418495 RepID=A0A1H2ZSR7_9PSEU|nr:M1 family metallopeptidase [Saccharopolyspora shandongensis]SDX19908.1 Peptidase family M1 [Saccharopolyspora shandongensis]
MRNRLLVTGAVAGVMTLGIATASAQPGSGGLGDPYFPDDGNSGYDVTRYDVGISYDPARPGYLEGDTTVTATASAELDDFHLDLSGFQVTEVSVDGVAAKSFGRAGEHELVITPASPIAAGASFAVRVRYSGQPGGGGWHTFPNGGANALGEPHSATSWYPANDHPSDKAAFHLTATVPEGWTVIGNGLPGETTTAGGKATFRWHEDQPIATYLTTVAIDKFTVRTSKLSDGTPVINAYSPGTQIDPATEEQYVEIMDVLAEKFGKYPFSSAGSIVLGQSSGENPGALETQTRPTYFGAIFDYPLLHENTHQWFGDNVSFTDWRDGCIAECFAQYSPQLWQEHNGVDIDKSFYKSTVEKERNNPDFWSVKLYDPGPENPLHQALYDKGSLMVHALRRSIGDEAFFGTLQQWQTRYAGGNASWPKFEELAKEVSGKDLDGFFEAWAHSTTIPPEQYLYPAGR